MAANLVVHPDFYRRVPDVRPQAARRFSEL